MVGRIDTDAPRYFLQVWILAGFIPTCICLFFVPNPWTMYNFYPMKEIPCPNITDTQFFSTSYNFHGESYHVN